jgi:hypothetical protein
MNLTNFIIVSKKLFKSNMKTDLNQSCFLFRTHVRRRSSTSTIRRPSSPTPTGGLQPGETYSPHSGRKHSKRPIT